MQKCRSAEMIFRVQQTGNQRVQHTRDWIVYILVTQCPSNCNNNCILEKPCCRFDFTNILIVRSILKNLHSCNSKSFIELLQRGSELLSILWINLSHTEIEHYLLEYSVCLLNVFF